MKVGGDGAAAEKCSQKNKLEMKARTLKITVSDPHATDDSSSDESSKREGSGQKKCTWIVPLQRKRLPRRPPPAQDGRSKQCRLDRMKTININGKLFRGIRPRYVGNKLNTMWSSQIWNKEKKKSEWLGTFERHEDAARAYDAAAVKLYGVDAITNYDPTIYLGSGQSKGKGTVDDHVGLSFIDEGKLDEVCQIIEIGENSMKQDSVMLNFIDADGLGMTENSLEIFEDGGFNLDGDIAKKFDDIDFGGLFDEDL